MYIGIQFCCQSSISNVHLHDIIHKNSNKNFTICHMAQITWQMTSMFKWCQQRKNITNTAYYLHIQREQTICQKGTEQKIVYSVITTDLLTGYTHTLHILLKGTTDSSKLQSYIKTKIEGEIVNIVLEFPPSMCTVHMTPAGQKIIQQMCMKDNTVNTILFIARQYSSMPLAHHLI